MKLRILLLLAATISWSQVKLTQAPDRIRIEIDGKHFSDYIISADSTKPYLHPLRTANGKQITRSFPMDLVEGEKRDHPHHRGLWFSHGDVNGWDFWANEKNQKGVGKGRGEIKVVKVKDLKSGKKSGSVSTVQDWIDGSGKRLLSEARTMTFYSEPGNGLRTMDFDITLTAVEESVFGDTKEGVFAMRLVRALEEESTGTMTSVDGEKEKNVWGKRSPWVDYSGTLDGEKLGVVILDHPSNPRHPTYWHSRAYGLFASNIFGIRDFTRDKAATGGAMTLKAGETMRFRFRVIIHPGDVKSFDPASSWKKFAALK
ncbi:MAG: PmoA family protein [Acidobacteria bacterium]|nr:PmoA family protein [Acidobacteriota bacterium]